MKYLLCCLTLITCCHGWFLPKFKHPKKKLFIVAIDGVRRAEAEAEFLPLIVELHREKWKWKWQNCEADQNFGYSLPAYATIFTGIVDRQVRNNNHNQGVNYPTLFDIFPKSQLFSSWYSLYYIVNKRSNVFIVPDSKERFSDQEVMNLFREKYNPESELTFIHLVDTDELAHSLSWDGYMKALRNSVKYIYELVREHKDAEFIVFTDHGRGKDEMWFGHGTGDLFEGSNEIWTLNISKREPKMACGHIAIFREAINVLKN